MESYRTVERAAVSEFVERRSRFIGAVCPVVTEASALEFIASKRREFWNAAHNVYAYVLRCDNIRRYSDDGEPQGTAGLPVLDVLLKEGLTDCAVVVTRYFGGVLLGTGGLVRAYAKGAKSAVDAGGVITMQLCTRALIECAYTQYGKTASLIPGEGGVIQDTRYSDRVEVEFLIPSDKIHLLQEKLTENSAGSLFVHVIGEEYAWF